jgi:hypothetical protein
MTTWETVDSSGGYYGRGYAGECALEAYEAEVQPYEHMAGAHEIRPDFLARWDAETIAAKHGQYHRMARDGQIPVSHGHGNPHEPFAATAGPASDTMTPGVTPEQLAASARALGRTPEQLAAAIADAERVSALPSTGREDRSE